jgi:hypothetical protein
VRSRLFVVVHVLLQEPVQASGSEDDHVIEALATD